MRILEELTTNVKAFKARRKDERDVSRAFYHARCCRCEWTYRPSTPVDISSVEARANAHKHQTGHTVDILFDLLDQFVDRVRGNEVQS